MLIYLSLHHFCDEGHSQILGSGEDGHLLFCLVLKPARVHETNKTHVSYLLRQKHQLYAQAPINLAQCLEPVNYTYLQTVSKIPAADLEIEST